MSANDKRPGAEPPNDRARCGTERALDRLDEQVRLLVGKVRALRPGEDAPGRRRRGRETK